VRFDVASLLENIKLGITSILKMGKTLNSMQQLLIHKELTRLREGERYKSPKSLVRYGDKIYSQNDEDGIINEIFTRIGTTNNTFVEFGIGDGLENNTLALLFGDWNGLWIEASPKSVKAIEKHFHEIISGGRLKIVESFITKDNINALISENISDDEVDLLSIDIDGNDYHVLNAIECISPRVIVAEYNSKFTPPSVYCMDYDENHIWQGDDCGGASLKFLESKLSAKGYCLVGCNITGVNAFFVREDLVKDNFLEPFTAENHYEPGRYYLGGYSSGHLASYSTLAKSLTMRSGK